MELNRDNYYSAEANAEYFSCSQFEDFRTCEAAAMAKIEGRWNPEPSEAFLVGNFFHSAMESEEAHEQFIEANRERIMTKNGKLRAGFLKAQEMIESARSDPDFGAIISRRGENEKIMTGKLFGLYPWKIRIDKYIAGSPRMIIDWKTVSNIWEYKWDDVLGGKGSFVERFGYLFRAAVYLEIEREYTGSDYDACFMIAAISKQDPPDKRLIMLNGRQRLDLELESIKRDLYRFQIVKNGLAAPLRCGRCAYCRSTGRAGMPIDYWELEPDNWPEPVEDDWC